MPRRRPFQYETLLRVRQRQEEVKGAALAAVRHEIAATAQQRTELVRQQMHMLEMAGQTARRHFAAAHVHHYYLHERYLARLAAEKDARVAELRRVEEQRRAELEEAMKRRRIVERLKELQQHEFLVELDRQRQRFVDEIATTRAAAARRGARSS